MSETPPPSGLPTELDPRAVARMFDREEPSGPAEAAAPSPVAMPTFASPHVLIVGVPRSGTTWVGRALALTRDAEYLHEPDNTSCSPYAYVAKRGLGAYPCLRSGAEAPAYARCWEAAFDGTQPAVGWRAHLVDALLERASPAVTRRVLGADPQLPLPARVGLALARPQAGAGAHRIVKSVHAALSVEWIAVRWKPRLLLIRRHPLDVLASWLALGLDAFLHDDDRLLGDRVSDDQLDRLGATAPPRSQDRVSRAAWLIGVLVSAVEAASRAVPQAQVVDHEVLCRDPLGELRWTARNCGLDWTDDADWFVDDSNQPGTGEALHRVAAAVPGGWRRRLEPEAVQAAQRVLRPFAISARYDGLG
jgi:hypothetical protein